MFKYIAEELKKSHIKGMAVKDERVLAFHNLDTAKRCVVFWVADDVSVSSVSKIREALSKHMKVDLLAFIRRPKLNPERIPEALYLESSGISYKGKFTDPKVLEVLDKKDGLFIDLSLKPDVLGDYIVKNAKSACKIGFNRHDAEHDIDFEPFRDVDDFTKRLLELLTKINTY